jgi:hypothetical protein
MFLIPHTAAETIGLVAMSRRADTDQANGPALLSLVLGVLSVLVVLFVSVEIGVILGGVAILAGNGGVVWARRRRGGGRTLAIAGIVFSLITLALAAYATFAK